MAKKPLQAKVLLEQIIKTSRKHYPSIPNCRFGYLMDQNRNLKPITKENAKILPADGSISSDLSMQPHIKMESRADSIIRKVRDVVKSMNEKETIEKQNEPEIIKRNDVSPKHSS